MATCGINTITMQCNTTSLKTIDIIIVNKAPCWG